MRARDSSDGFLFNLLEEAEAPRARARPEERRDTAIGRPANVTARWRRSVKRQASNTVLYVTYKRRAVLYTLLYSLPSGLSTYKA